MNSSSILSYLSDPSFDSANLNPNSFEGAKELWNSILSIPQHNYPLSSQKILADLRFSSLDCIQKSAPSLDIDCRWMRTSKAYIDIKNFEKASECLNRVKISEETKIKTKLNFYFWKGQIDFFSGLEYFTSFEQLISLCKEMSYERFRVARFLYVEICGKLQQSKKYSEMVRVLKICLSIADCEDFSSLKEIKKECLQLLAECYVETSIFDKAEKIIENLEKDDRVFLLNFKLFVYCNNIDQALILFKKMLSTVNSATLIKAVQILLSKNKSLDACKCLYEISEKFNDCSAFIIWFKILFALEIVDQLNISYEHLNIYKVLGLLKGSDNKEYTKLLWDYIQELFYKGKYFETIQTVNEFWLPYAKNTEKILAYKFICKSWLGLNNPEESWKALQEYSDDLIGMRLRILIRLGRFSEIDFGLFESIEFNDLIEILKDLYEFNKEKFGETMKKIGKSVVEKVENIEHKENLLQWLCLHDTDTDHLFEYFKIVQSFCCKKNEWFGIQAWNLSIDQTSPELKLLFMQISVNLLQFLNPHPESYKQILFSACKYTLSTNFTQFYSPLHTSLQNFPSSSQDLEYFFLNFEFALIFNQTLPVASSVSFENLKKLSKIAQKHSKFQVSKNLLQNILSIKTDHEALKEILKICGSLEESEQYLNQAVQFYDCENKDGAEWVIAYCWNNAIVSPNIFQNSASKQWLKYALTISTNTMSPYTERILSMYNRINSL